MRYECSYHGARFKNKNETAQAAGNSPQMIDEFYRELVEPEDAEKFFSIMPWPVSYTKAHCVPFNDS